MTEMGYLTYPEKLKDNFFLFSFFNYYYWVWVSALGFLGGVDWLGVFFSTFYLFLLSPVVLHLAAKTSPCRGLFLQ